MPGAPVDDGWLTADDEELTGPDVCGIVLAGSYHWGDGVFERVLRGPLLPVAQTPVICYSLEWLRAGGVRSSVVCANSSTAPVRAFLGDGAQFGMQLDYFEDHEPRGPAGCAHDAARRSFAGTFVVVEGTLIPSLDLRALLRAHRESGAAATVVVEVERRRRELSSDRPAVPGGIYVFERRVLEQITSRGYQDIKQGLLERLHATGQHVAVHEVAGLAPRVLDYSTYASVSQWLITRAIDQPGFLANYLRVGEGRHHPSAQVHPSARLIGPVILGAHARVDEGAVIVGPSSIGVASVVQAGALVSRSIVWDYCSIGEHAIVDSSLLSDRAVVKPHERMSGMVNIPRGTIGVSTPTAGAPSIPPAKPDKAGQRRTRRPSSSPVRLPPAFAFPFSRLNRAEPHTGEHPTLP